MTEPMQLSRFAELVAAYGAIPRSWPEDERAAAEAFARTDQRAAALLDEADTLDAMLFAYRAPAPSAALHARVIASVPTRRRFSRRVRLWWTSLAFGVAAASGTLVGSAAAAALDRTANQQIEENEIAPGDTLVEEIAP